jgi:hypothetical protein
MGLVLQAGALYARATTHRADPRWHTDRVRVVCLGDSNPYGITVPRDQTYPFHLERIWNVPGRPVEVINVGFPGLNSSKARASFRELMAALRPDIVLLQIRPTDLHHRQPRMRVSSRRGPTAAGAGRTPRRTATTDWAPLPAGAAPPWSA